MPEASREVPPGRSFTVVAWGVLALTTAVILGGAVVRATNSGAGCGQTWPRCQGHIIPFTATSETVIEFTHRAMTATLGVAIVALAVWTRRRYPPRHRVRTALWVGLGLFVVESLIGASLVVFGWVETDASVARAFVVPLHLVNTFLLLGVFTLVAHFAGGGKGFELRPGRAWDRWVLAGLAIILVAAASGALNALADTLHEADSVAGGIRDEFGPAAPFLLRLRTVHPLIAIAGCLALYALARRLGPLGGRTVGRLARGVQLLVWIQFAIGIVNIALLTPLETQLVHLLAADALWVLFVLLGARLLAVPVAARSPEPSSLQPVGELV
jgi:cytochrome c oxidase assembly protein subunit 15